MFFLILLNLILNLTDLCYVDFRNICLHLMACCSIEHQIFASVSDLVRVRSIFYDVVILVDYLIQNTDVPYLFLDFLGFATSLAFFLWGRLFTWDQFWKCALIHRVTIAYIQSLLVSLARWRFNLWIMNISYSFQIGTAYTWFLIMRGYY